MYIIYKFKDGATITQEMDELQSLNFDDGFLKALKEAKANNEVVKAETTQGLIEKPLSELSSLEIVFS